jgi:hypothetical protein
MIPAELSENLDLLRQRATRLARAAKQLQADHDAACYIDGRFMIPSTVPRHFDEFDHARADVLEMIARQDDNSGGRTR